MFGVEALTGSEWLSFGSSGSCQEEVRGSEVQGLGFEVCGFEFWVSSWGLKV